MSHPRRPPALQDRAGWIRLVGDAARVGAGAASAETASAVVVGPVECSDSVSCDATYADPRSGEKRGGGAALDATRPRGVPSEVDLQRPNVARMHDYYLGGAHNFAADRELADGVLRIFPRASELAMTNRFFLRDALRRMHAAGIRQFLDLGAGIPTVGALHAVAQDLDPACRVLAVDREAVVVSRTRALLADNPLADVVQADLRDVDLVLGSAPGRRLIDGEKPLGILVGGVLHFLSESDEPEKAIFDYHREVAPGSHLALSHIVFSRQGDDGCPPGARERIGDLYARSSGALEWRTLPEVARLFGPFSLVDPGLAPLGCWRTGEYVADSASPPLPAVAGLARKR
ncbi:SAM-dependent methyltransferase [Actinoalloteichus caeruleus]|uniref:SAM-dependent methyltransferase n=1 Tax=Actinoalloteichus cyanogriseus TaxID=2893586 RepID=UPI0009DF4CEB|nr:SAM-dependent methyltransferase [Actinoalloteichus caeruleus]